MIVVIGSVTYRPAMPGRPDGAEGRAAAVAHAVVAGGCEAQLVARIGDDPPGDALLLALAREGIGHAAVLRDAGTSTVVTAPDPPEPDDPFGEAAESAGSEPSNASTERVDAPDLRAADLELALRYLREFGGVVVADPVDGPAAEAIVAATSYAGAHLVALVPAGSRPSPAFEAATVLEAPESDPDGDFARFVGSYAAGLDRGLEPAEAFREATAGAGWEHAEA